MARAPKRRATWPQPSGTVAEWPYCWPWPTIRLRVLDRDGWRCQINGPLCLGKATEVDHIRSWRIPGVDPYDMTNLRAACKPCNSQLGGRAAHQRPVDRTTAPPSRDW